MSCGPVANFDNEVTLFTRIISRECATRVAFVSGESLVGKTTLLERFGDVCVAMGQPYVIANLKRPHDPHALLDHIAETLPDGEMSDYWTYSDEVASAEPSFSLKNFHSWFSKIQVSFSSAGQVRAQQRRLTREFFKAWQKGSRGRVLAILLDHYEAAPLELREWVADELLPKTCRSSNVVAVVAGQQLPPNERMSPAPEQMLLGSIELEHWSTYIDRLGVVVPAETLRGLHHALDGRAGPMALKLHQLQQPGKQ